MKKGLYLLTTACLLMLGACEMDNESVSPSNELADGGGFSSGGSMARFTFADDQLYVVTPSKLKFFNVADPANIQETGELYLNFGAETLFPYGDNLFIGTNTGMKIYDITDPASPEFVNEYAHVTSCDPVVVQNNTAYVTLRSEAFCWGVNELHILDISDLQNIQQIGLYQMDNPHGLGVDGNNLFLCEGQFGLKVFDISDPINLSQRAHYTIGHTYDVIPHDKLAIVVGKDQLIQYQYDDMGNMTQLGTLDIAR